MNIFFSRQPVFNTSNNTVGYTLKYTHIDPEMRQREDELQGSEGYFRQYYDLFFKEKLAFMGFSRELILDNVPWRLPNSTLNIEVNAEMLTDREVLEKCFALKRNGFNIVLKDYLYDSDSDELFKFGNMIKFNINANRERVKKTIEHAANFGKQVIVSGVDTYEKQEFAVEAGCTYIEGDFYTNPILLSKPSGGPMVRTFLQILAMVYSPEPDIEKIAAVISTDPVLTIRLLRQINTVFEGKYNTVSTVLQALVMLGLDKLKQWVYLVGLQRLNRDAPVELLKTALFRANFCERIARITPGAGMKAKEMYLMGLISIITGTGGNNEQFEKTLDELPISSDIRGGLTGKEGIFNDVYQLAHSFEWAKWDKVDEYVNVLSVDREALADQYTISIKFANGFTRLG